MILALVLLSAPALADEPAGHAWELDVKAGWIIMGGSSTRATGGIMPTLAGRHLWPVGESFAVSVGADLGIFGLGGGSHWIGVLGGPTVGATWKPMASLDIYAAIRGDFGRIPTCNAWGLCLRYVGIFPAAEMAVSYAPSSHLAIVGAFAARYISTMGWTGIGYEPSVSGRVMW